MNVVDKKCVEFIKGVALSLMVTHHAFGFPYYYIDAFSHLDYGGFVYVADKIFKICVPVFAFLTSYLFVLHKDKSLRYVCYKVSLLFASYWVALIVMLLAHYFTTDFSLDICDILNEMFVIDEQVGRFSWYVWFYAVCMLILYLIAKVESLSKHASWLNNLVMFAGVIVFSKCTGTGDLWEYTWFPAVIMGWYIAKYDCFNKLFAWLDKRIDYWQHYSVGFAGLALSLLMWHALTYVPVFAARLIAVVPFVLFSIVLARSVPSVLSSFFAVLGRYSLFIWFIHAIFFSVVTRDVWQPLVYTYCEPWLVVPSIIAICLPVSVLLSKIQSELNKKLKVIFF